MQVGFGVGFSHADILSAGYDSQNEAMTDFAGGAPVTGSLEVSWIHGFGEGWPDRSVSFDLGGRVLEVLGSPGHHPAAITVYDPWTGVLLTGDTVYPGRL